MRPSQDGMNRAQASAVLAVCLLFASCGGNGADSNEQTWTKRQVLQAAGLKQAPGGYVHPQSGCEVTTILISRDEVQERASAGELVATNQDGSAGVVVDEKPGRPARLTACLLVMKRELLPLGRGGGDAS
jgi:hypothetical protein